MLYTLDKMKNLRTVQEKILTVLSNEIDDFYLVGGTALSLYYFHHRQSQDLDFFTKKFNKVRIKEIISFLSAKLKMSIELIAQQMQKSKIKMLVYSAKLGRNEYLKIDFVEDFTDFIHQPKLINGIKVLSLEDIYLRKIYAITGGLEATDIIGRKFTKGGRQEAKDFYDLYCLSNIFMRLSKFSFKYCNQLTREAIIRWFRTYDRLHIKTGLLELSLKKDIDYNDIERHFKREIDKVLEKEVELI